MASPPDHSPLARALPAGQRGCAGLKWAFNKASGAGSKPCAFIKAAGVTPASMWFLRHEQPQRQFFITSRQICMGEMDMGERFLALVPKLAGAPKLGEDVKLDGLLISRGEQRQRARLVVEGKARAALFVFRKWGGCEIAQTNRSAEA